jgi:ATP-dependent RNA helicase RhlE
MTFETYGLDPRCLQVLAKRNISEPTPIQERAIPIALEGRDLIGLAQTGTGKTLAYVLPSITRLAAGRVRKNQMLVLVPTRELAVQVHEVVEEFGKPLGIKSVPVYGGVSIDKQRVELKEGRHVVVATPGRLLDQMARTNVKFDDLAILVMDEADRMLDMGFLPDIKRIVRHLRRERQTLMFSATFPDEIAYLAGTMMHEPERVTVGFISKPVETVRQLLYPVKPEDKITLLFRVLKELAIPSALIFFRTRERTERLSKALRKEGFSVAAIHGNRSQREREEALSAFRSGEAKILVATDIAARGLDIEGVTHIINFDIPPSADDYIHRIGRTARAHATGDAITFVSPSDMMELERIEGTVGRRLPRVAWDGAPPILSLFRPPEDKKEVVEGPEFGGRNKRVHMVIKKQRRR